jgi:hypothetical protein
VLSGFNARQTNARRSARARLRRGLARQFALERLIGAAMKLGLPVKIYIGKRPPPKREDGREGTRRPKKTRADQIV